MSDSPAGDVMTRTPFTWLGHSLKWLLALSLGMALLACGSSSDSDQTTAFSSTLTGEQEVPAALTGAVGTGSLSLDLPSRTIRGSITLDGMTATAAHIHQGDVGVSGPVIVPLVETSPGVWSVSPGATLTEAQVNALNAGGLYFNAHTAANPNGEIRGQIGRDVLTAQLSPRQEVPATASLATGSGVLAVDPATGRFTARMTVTGMAATAAHIHEAAAGVNGPIIFPLTQTAPGSGVWVAAADATMSEAQLNALRAGRLYFNAHSVAFPNGEIRGQIGRHVGIATLLAAEEVPPTPSNATGAGTLVVDAATRAIEGGIRVAGLAATAAHIHIGAPATNGPIIVPLNNAGSGSWPVPPNTRLTAAQYLAFKQGNLYFNAHSVAFPNGEIRGQIR
jgi:hypothetical protein